MGSKVKTAEILSKNKVKIRLTEERWKHIVNSHLELSAKDFSKIVNTIKHPDIVLKGDMGELLAVRKKSGSRQYYVVPYKELDGKDGFILTAYLTTDLRWLLQKEVIWNKK